MEKLGYAKVTSVGHKSLLGELIYSDDAGIFFLNSPSIDGNGTIIGYRWFVFHGIEAEIIAADEYLQELRILARRHVREAQATPQPKPQNSQDVPLAEIMAETQRLRNDNFQLASLLKEKELRGRPALRTFATEARKPREPTEHDRLLARELALQKERSETPPSDEVETPWARDIREEEDHPLAKIGMRLVPGSSRDHMGDISQFVPPRPSEEFVNESIDDSPEGGMG